MYFLDTNICIYALKGRYPKIKKMLQQFPPAAIKIPSIVKGELLFGAKKSSSSQKTLAVLQQFLLPFQTIPFCQQAAGIYADIRYDLEKKGKLIGPNDMIIAATVLASNGTLITHNTKEFKRVKSLKIADWTK